MTAVHPAPRPVPHGVPRRVPPVLLAGVVVAGMALSAWGARDRTTWFLETVWVLVGLPLVVLTWRRFPLTQRVLRVRRAPG
ncbi:hypothetical protein ABZ372_54995, partial [Streptomyces sp. NPDC005921]